MASPVHNTPPNTPSNTPSNTPQNPSPNPPPLPPPNTLQKALQTYQRRIIQLLAALLYNLNLPGFANASIYQGSTKSICVPGLNCYSCPGAIGACPIGSLQSALAIADRKLPFYIVGTILAFGALFGRTICGWLCPFGLIQDLLDKLPLPKLRKGRWSRIASGGKYLVLGVTVIGIPLGLALFSTRTLPFFCAWLCPAGTLEAGIPLVLGNEGLRALLGGQFLLKLVLLICLIVACLFIYRPFCRFLCPLGALYSFFNRVALLRYRVDTSRCVHCNACVTACKMDVGKLGDRECIHCGACKGRCRQQAITFTLTDILSRAAGSAKSQAPMPLSKENSMKKKNNGDKNAAFRTTAIRLFTAMLALALAVGSFACAAPKQPTGPAGQTTSTEGSSDSSSSGNPSTPSNSNGQNNSGDQGQPANPSTGGPLSNLTSLVWEGAPAPDFAYVTTDGTSGSLADLQGKVVFLNLWASWCGPCVVEMPDIARLKTDYPELEVLAVNVADDPDSARGFIADVDYPFHWILDEEGTIEALYPSGAIPYTIIINREGVVTKTFLGSPRDTYNTYEQYLKQAGL